MQAIKRFLKTLKTILVLLKKHADHIEKVDSLKNTAASNFEIKSFFEKDINHTDKINNKINYTSQMYQ